jgi:hypothetical protein
MQQSIEFPPQVVPPDSTLRSGESACKPVTNI